MMLNQLSLRIAALAALVAGPPLFVGASAIPLTARQVNACTNKNDLNVDACGAVGDNRTDDTAPFNAALAESRQVLCSHGKTYLIAGRLYAPLPNAVLDLTGCKLRLAEMPSTTQFLDIEVSNVTVRGLYLVGVGRGIQIGATVPVHDIQIIDLICDSSAPGSGLSQCIYWGAVTNLQVERPTFISTGYGMLQIPGKPSRGLRITHGSATDMYGDAIEQNGQDAGVAADMLIDDFTFNGSHGFPKPATEQRFAGFTSVNGLIITNSHIKNASGDSCLHLEGSSEHIALSNNTWTDCGVSGGNSGYIYPLTSSADITESGDAFVFTGALPGETFAFDLSSGNYGNSLKIDNVKLTDLTGQHRFSGFNLAFHNGPVAIENTNARGLKTFVRLLSTIGANISGNEVSDSLNGILSDAPNLPSGGGGINITLTGNRMICIQWCILTGPNTNGTSPPVNWRVRGNFIRGRVSGVAVDR
jgi:hypothetical protein